MYTMIIADDESIARKSLELFIQKEFGDIQIIAQATNGIELVKLVEENEPDIAIVDINMPGITGIDAIELLTQKRLNTKFIINTAYSEFEYVKKALDMKVHGYLLKPGKYEESVSTVKRLCEDIKVHKNEFQEKSKRESLLHVISPRLENEILLSLITNQPAIADFATFCEVNHFQFTSGYMISMLECNSKKIDKKVIKDEIEKTLSNLCNYLVSVNEADILLLLFVPKQINDTQKKEWSQNVAKLISEQFEHLLKYKFLIGVGNIYSAFSDMVLSYEESRNEIRKMTAPISSKVIAEKGSNHTECDIKASIYVGRAVSYIERNYAKDISLDMVAEHIKISSYYLSRLFKQELGISFVEYLTEQRIKEAIELSQTTSLPVKEIAQKCGYCNETYFCKVFKKHTNKTISEYRRDL